MPTTVPNCIGIFRFPPACMAMDDVCVEMPGVLPPEVPSWSFGDLSASITTGSRRHA
jgi:hypothetical protein